MHQIDILVELLGKALLVNLQSVLYFWARSNLETTYFKEQRYREVPQMT